MDFKVFHTSEQLSAPQKKEFFTTLSQYEEISESLKEISDWLADRDVKKQISQTESFLDSL